MSTQLRRFEEALCQALFDRREKQLMLTEAGRVAFEYAETIVGAGTELLDVMRHRPTRRRELFRVGAVATLSRNFQMEALRPFLGQAEIDLVLRSAGLGELLVLLESHLLDVVLTNQMIRRDSEPDLHGHQVLEQPLSLVTRMKKRAPFRFPYSSRDVPVCLPSLENASRAEFDLRLTAANVRPRILGEAVDMAMLRLLARETDAHVLVPRVVVRDELKAGALVESHRFRDLHQPSYAVRAYRRRANPRVGELIAAFKSKRSR